MKTALIALVLFFSANAFAISKYDRIQNLFNAAISPTLDEINDIWWGRCYNSSYPENGQDSTFGVPEFLDTATVEGPEFPPRTVRILTLVNGKYDRNSSIQYSRNRVVDPMETGTSIDVVDPSYRYEYEIRRNEKYILVHGKTTGEYCYYWEKAK